MSTTTTLQVDSLPDPDQEKKSSSRVHSVQYIPANIDHNGPEEIDIYFNNFIRENKDKKCLENALRGYPLEGEVFNSKA